MAESKSSKTRSPGLFLVLPFLAAAVFSQGLTNLGENVNYWNKGQTPVFVADSLYMGAPFLRDTTKPLVVTYLGSQASWLGYLYLMVPNDTGSIVATGGKRYTRIFIMTNHEMVGAAGLPYNQVDLTNAARGKIHNLDTVIFDYQTYWGSGHWNNPGAGYMTTPHFAVWADTIPAPYTLGARYSGPNRSPLDLNPNGTPQWNNVDPLWSTDKSLLFPNNQWGAVGNNYVQGRRWCVAGWVRFENLNINSDTAEFGFEDENDSNPGAPLGWNGAGDKNFNDIVYHVTGLYIIRGPGFLQLYSKPGAPGANNPALGGIDSATVGQPFTIYAHVFDSLYNWVPASDSLVTWTITSVDSAGNPVLTTLKGSSTGFLPPQQAFGSVVITATFKNPNNPNKPPITATITVYIGPGPGNHIVIEADSLARNTRSNRPVGTITVNRTANVTVYAVVRDTFGNFVRFANNAAWSMANPGVAAATPLVGRLWAASVSEQSFGTTTLTASEPGLSPGTAVVTCTGANAAVPVTATLLDTNGNGHLDRMDIVLPDSVNLAAALPTVQQWILSMNIVTDDGGSKVTLTPGTMTETGPHTIQVTLVENKGSTLETGWTSAVITLSNAPMTTDGRPLYVATILDGAEPVVKAVCFVPVPSADTLRVILSSPQSQSPKPLDPYALLSVVQQNGTSVPISAATVPVVKLDDRFLYVFPPSALSDLDSVKAGAMSLGLELCGNVSIVVTARAANNPFSPATSTIPANMRGPNDPLHGTRIEIVLVRAVQQELLSGKIRASISIFDAVGNAIVDNRDMEVDQNNVSLYLIWNGKTRQGILAAPGTYLARMTLVDTETGVTESIRKNVGIKK